MFESLKATLADLLGGRATGPERRSILHGMKSALVHARMGVEDLEAAVQVTRTRLAEHRAQLATMQRRKALAEGIGDAETVALAAKHETQHAERVAVLERKLEAQEAEATLVRAEYEEMMAQVKAANAGVGSAPSAAPRGPTDEELGLPDDSRLRSELDGLARQRQRAEKDASADAALEALKKRMASEG
ncbi:MAG: hypothetical protein K2X99_05275 [Gemmatimonadaceae bacterium]|nr:hypothetical protein [Gemmatimonadaceae bacterium]